MTHYLEFYNKQQNTMSLKFHPRSYHLIWRYYFWLQLLVRKQGIHKNTDDKWWFSTKIIKNWLWIYKHTILIIQNSKNFRTVVVVEHRALSRLTDILNIILERTKESGQSNFPEGELIVTLDVLKALFNLTCYLDNHTCDEEENSLLVKLCQIIQTLIITPVSTGDKKFELVGWVLNLAHFIIDFIS